MAAPSNVDNVSNRLKKLEDIEKKIMMAMKTAGKSATAFVISFNFSCITSLYAVPTLL